MLKIEIKSKTYSNDIVLKNLELEITEPGLYGLIGKNGQGKTTLFKCALGLEKYEGKSYLGKEKVSLINTAFCPAEPILYDELTTEEFNKFYAKLFMLEPSKDYLFDLPKDKLIKQFSTGMKKKTYLNALFQKDFLVYFLDEPFNGLDIEANYILLNYLKEKSKTSIIIISSHIIDVLYNNCKGIYMLKNNKTTYFNHLEFDQLEIAFFNNQS